MTTIKERAAMQQALEALEKAEMVYAVRDVHPMAVKQVEKAIAALREALAEQAEQSSVAATPTTLAEPVAWWHPKMGAYDNNYFDAMQPLYLSPVRTKDLTDDEIEQLENECEVGWNRVFARAVIAKFKEKNRG